MLGVKLDQKDNPKLSIEMSHPLISNYRASSHSIRDVN